MHTQKKKEIKVAIQPIIADALLQFRITNGLTQEGMARKLKISVRTYVDLEHGHSLASATTLAFFLTLLQENELSAFLKSMRKAIEQ